MTTSYLPYIPKKKIQHIFSNMEIVFFQKHDPYTLSYTFASGPKGFVY